MNTRTLCILAASLLAAGTVQATEKAQQTGLPTYEELDENGDDVLALPEMVVKAPHIVTRIRHCDTNGDDRITREEYAACKPKPAEGAAGR